MFGDIYTTFTSIENYIDESFEYRVEGIRWPGGSLAEGKTDGRAGYDLTSSDVYAFDSKTHTSKGLEGILRISSELNQPFSMVIPTLPIFKKGQDSSVGIQSKYLAELSGDFKIFYQRFVSRDGHYDSALDLIAKEQVSIFEIGNETAHLGWHYGSYDADWNYGTIAASILGAASDLDAEHSYPNIQIAVQMGMNVGGAQSIINEINQHERVHRADLFGQIDRLVSHNMLVYSAQDFNVNLEAQIIDVWMEAVGRNDPDHQPSLYASAWSVGDHRFGHNIFSDGEKFSLIDRSDFSVSSQYFAYYHYLLYLEDNDTGARQGSGTADVFAKMIALGYTSAALWGTADPQNHSNSYQSVWHQHSWNDLSHDKSAPLSHGGEVLAMISENLIGFSVVSGGSVASKADGDLSWNAAYFNEEDRSGAGQVNSYHFSDGDDVSFLLSVTDIDGWLSTSDGVLDYTVKVPNGTDTVTVQSVGTEFRSQEWKTFRNNPENEWIFDGFSNTQIQSFRRLFEAPVTSKYTIDLSASDEFIYTFTSDFETVLLTFNEYSSALSNEEGFPVSTNCLEGTRRNESQHNSISETMAAQSFEFFAPNSTEREDNAFLDTLIDDDFDMGIRAPYGLTNHSIEGHSLSMSNFAPPHPEILGDDIII